MELEREFTFRSTNLPQCCFPFFSEIRNQDKFCDIRFTVGERRVSAHRLILAAVIPLFREILTSEDEIPVPDIDPPVFECLIDYAYSCELKITMENVRGLLLGSCVMRMKDVQGACCEFLSQRLHPQNVLSFRDVANNLNIPQLKEFTDLYIKENFEEVCETEEFLNSPITHVTEIIGADDLNVESEEKVFQSVLRWVKASASARKDNLPELLRKVRMTLLKPLYLTDALEREELLRTSLAARDLVEEARNYNLFPERRKTMRSFSTETRKFMRLSTLEDQTNKTIYSLNSTATYTVLQFDLANRTWSTKFTQGYWESNGCFAVLNDKMYFFHGYTSEYDPKSNKQKHLTHSTLRRRQMAAVSLKNKIFVCGGYLSGLIASSVVECFDPGKNEWTEINSLLTARWSLKAVSLADYIYALGGRDRHQVYGIVERYSSVTGKWQYVPSMLSPRRFFGAAVLNGKIYVCGGCRSTESCMATAEVYDPIANKWKSISPMNVARSVLNLVAFCGQLYSIAGKDSQEKALYSCEVYDPETDKWVYGPSVSSPHRSAAAAVI